MEWDGGTATPSGGRKGARSLLDIIYRHTTSYRHRVPSNLSLEIELGAVDLKKSVEVVSSMKFGDFVLATRLHSSLPLRPKENYLWRSTILKKEVNPPSESLFGYEQRTRT
jgi:hypothetical protein